MQLETELVAALIGALAAVITVLFAQVLTARAQRRQELLDRRLNAGAAILAELPEMSRRLTNFAYLDEALKSDRSLPEVQDYNSAAVRWNAALTSGLAFLSNEQCRQLLDLDREVDRLLNLANENQFQRVHFRQERSQLGVMAATLINDLRASAGLETIDQRSIWSWDSPPDQN